MSSALDLIGPPADELDELAARWADLLSAYRWDWFVTLTFRPPPRPRVPERWTFSTRLGPGEEGIAKAWRWWIREQEREIGATRDVAHWARADEPHKSGAMHCHALVGWPREPSRWGAMQLWARDRGWARVEPPDADEAVRRYCAKYCSKNGTVTLGGALRPTWRLGAPGQYLRDVPPLDA